MIYDVEYSMYNVEFRHTCANIHMKDKMNEMKGNKGTGG